METIEGPGPGPARQVWNFARHFLEMCIAMCVGGSILMAAVFGVVTRSGSRPFAKRLLAWPCSRPR